VFPVWDELGFYIPDDDILHSYRRENLKSYIYLHHFLFNSLLGLLFILKQRSKFFGTSLNIFYTRLCHITESSLLQAYDVQQLANLVTHRTDTN
jgi:hypothetical protein